MYFILVITFHFISTDESFLKEFATLKSYYFTLRKEERFIYNIEGKIFSVM